MVSSIKPKEKNQNNIRQILFGLFQALPYFSSNLSDFNFYIKIKERL